MIETRISEPIMEHLYDRNLIQDEYLAYIVEKKYIFFQSFSLYSLNFFLNLRYIFYLLLKEKNRTDSCQININVLMNDKNQGKNK